ncbi:hypothetical protein [Paenibacillus xylanilyticus]|uniref:Uncharacterized protein n=1 Tax=Paenibacillus xylanilyticus TaxID=248903 RepID=A0A7Y6BTS3_9BACL|nr:hypothetical protein [Paenibacillus xylanilyticus]NUU74251.1 hypothetical protein [Paenibacillus xylanilyticus]
MITEAFTVDYGAKVPLKFEPYVIDSYVREDFLSVIYDHASRNIIMSTAVKMDDARLYRLIEKTAISICKSYSPTTNYGIKKAEIRAAILALITHYKGEITNE